MAEVNLLIATFYNQEKVGNLADVICPPYDVVSPSEEIALYQKTLTTLFVWRRHNLSLRTLIVMIDISGLSLFLTDGLMRLFW